MKNDLTARQESMFRLAGDGYTAAEIASELGLSVSGVKQTLAVVRRKRGLEAKREMVRDARAYFAERDAPA